MSTTISDKTPQTIHRQRVGEIPLLLSLSERLGLREILSRYIKSHANLRYPTADSLMLLLFNMTSGRQPLYELEQRVLTMDSRLFDCPCFEEGLFNDDRFGSALDRL